MANKKVDVYSEGCISCGACVAICNNIFKFNKDNKSYAANQPKDESELECAKQAEAACPVNVITVKQAVNNADYNPNNDRKAA